MDLNRYDPALEFPGFEEPIADEVPREEASRRSFHLVVVHSPVLSSKRRVAILSSFSEISIGRDKPPNPTSPRLRLKEMAVSKYHAIIYWDADRDAWGLIDVGSVHGTFVRDQDGAREERLSPPKVASHPRYLKHLDVVRIGGTQLVCHIHGSNEASCGECNVTPSNKLVLASEVSSTAPSSGTNSVDSLTAPSKDVKLSLAQLRRHLLSRHGPSISKEARPTTYVDRAAVRREQLGISQPPMATSAPPTPTSRLRTPRTRAPSPDRQDGSDSPIIEKSIPVSNVGHRLLAKQGWTPGTGLGADQNGRAEPIVAKASVNRAGIGSDSLQPHR